MTIPIKVFDMERYRPDEGLARCIRCESWVPTNGNGPFSGGLDPHIEDHVIVYFALREVDRKARLNGGGE